MQTTSSWTRDGSKNDFLYNAGNELNSNTQWYETFFRAYDPALGKFLQVDPKADKYGSLTTYNYAGNNPVVFNDPLGDDLEINIDWDQIPDGETMVYQDASAGMNSDNGFANMFGGAGNAFQVADAMHDALNGRYNALWNSMCYGSRMGANGATDKGALYGYGRWVHKDFYNVTTINGEEVGREYTHTEVKWEAVQDALNRMTVDEFIEFKNFFFKDEISFVSSRTKITWQINTFMADWGFTGLRQDRTIDIKISVLLGIKSNFDAKHLYLTVGHEIVHATDFVNGNYDRWKREIEKEYSSWDSDGRTVKEVLDAAKEYSAYKWSSAMETKFGQNYGHGARMREAQRTLETWGMMWLFEN